MVLGAILSCGYFKCLQGLKKHHIFAISKTYFPLTSGMKSVSQFPGSPEKKNEFSEIRGSRRCRFPIILYFLNGKKLDENSWNLSGKTLVKTSRNDGD